MDLKSNEPFWLVKNGIINSFPSLRENIQCDVLIVGGGITGSLIAHQCIKEGYNTVLVDKREIANGSSSATTSMLQYEIDTPLYELIEMIGNEGAISSYKACYDSIDTLNDICKEIKSKAGFRKKKSLYFASYKKDIDWLKQEYNCRKDNGFPVQWLSSDEIFEKFKIENTYGGILSNQGASVDAFHLVHELLSYNVKRGLRVFDKTKIVNVVEKNKEQVLTTHTGAEIQCKKIIYCVGYESASMIPEKFVDLISTYAIASEIQPQDIKKYENLLVWNTAEPYIYLRTTDDGRMLIGGEDETFRDPNRRDKLISKKANNLQIKFKKHIPSFDFLTDFRWAGTFGETKDGLPYIGTHPKFKNSYFVLGFGGNGITFSVIGMDMVSQWLNGQKHSLSKWFQFGR